MSSKSKIPKIIQSNPSICAHCTESYTPKLRSTKKFIVHENNPGNGAAKSSKSSSPSQTTIKVWESMIDIINWRLCLWNSNSAPAPVSEVIKIASSSIDPNVSVCQNCGLLIAKLYSTIQCLKKLEKSDESYFGKVVQKSLVGAEEKINLKSKSSVPRRQADGDGVGEVYDDFGNDDIGEIDEAENAAVQAAQAATTLATLNPNPNPRRQKVSEEERPYKCGICNAGFFKETHCRRHLLLTHDVGDRSKQFQCSNCSRAFYFAYQLREHERCHSELRSFSCPIVNCGKKLKCKKDWYQHCRFHHPESIHYKSYTCRFCGKIFKEARAHRNHENYVHQMPKESRAFKCPDCDKTYHRKDNLRTHQLKTCRAIASAKTPHPHVPSQENPQNSNNFTGNPDPPPNPTVYSCSRKCGQSFCTKPELDAHDMYYCPKSFEIQSATAGYRTIDPTSNFGYDPQQLPLPQTRRHV